LTANARVLVIGLTGCCSRVVQQGPPPRPAAGARATPQPQPRPTRPATLGRPRCSTIDSANAAPHAGL